MLEIVVLLAIIALVLLFLRAGRQNTIVYRKKVAPRDRDYSISDHSSVFGPTATSDYYPENERASGHTPHETMTLGGGEFGGAGAGDSYDVAPTDPLGGDFTALDAGVADFSSSDSSGSDSNNSDSGSADSGSSDSCSDSSGDYTSFSGD